MAESVSLLMSHLNCVLYILRSLGFLVNEKKSILAPSQEIEFLGLVIDSVSLSFSLPTVKVDKVIQLCEKALRAERISLRELASLLGNFSWAIPTVPFAQAHYRILQRFFISESRKFNGNLNKVVSLPPFAKKDIDWWFSNLRSFNGKTMISDEPDVVIFSDASLTGWGACCEEITTRGPWILADKSRHINELELLGAFYALQVFTQHSSDISVQLYLDNSTAVSYINKCGGTRSKALCDLASCVINWCEFRNIQLSAFHLPGSLNVVADCESRSAMDASDWMLDKRLFQKIRSLWRVEIDLFASAWNAQLPAFVSWIRQPLALTTNAFSLSWKKRLNYAFPPFSLIPRCLAKIRKEKASVVLVCPLWPSQAWFPLLLELASDIPRLLSPHQSTNIQSARATSSQRLAHSDRLETIRQRFRDKRFSEDVIKLLLGANRSSTQSSYQSAWNSWFDWCTQRNFDPLSNDLAVVLEYLTDLHKAGYASRSINGHRSMLSMTLYPYEGSNIGEHPLVVQLLKGCYNENPPRPRYESTWDTDVVLDYLSSLGNDESLDFAQLSLKLLTVLALVTLMRIGELNSISCSSVCLSTSKVTFSLLRLRKKQHSGPLQSFSIPAFTGSLVCPVKCFREYWTRTSKLRNPSCQSLFVITKKPHTATSTSTLGRWIKKCLSDAGIDDSVFSAHSTRGAGASKAAASGVATESILRAASWSSESTFARHYNRPITSPDPVPAAIFSQTSSRLQSHR